MWNARVDKLRAISEQAVSIAAELQRRVQAGGLTQDQALQQYRDAIRPIRYDGSAGYYFAYAMDGTTLILGPTPEAEGTSRIGIKDADGKLFIQAMIEAARRGGDTVVYRYPKPGSTVAQPKLAYVQPIPSWNMLVGTGLYIDDLRVATMAGIIRFGAVVCALLLVCIVVAWTVSHGVTGPLSRLRRSMASVANGDLSTNIVGQIGKTRSAAWPVPCWCSRTAWPRPSACGPSRRRSSFRRRPSRKLLCITMADGFESKVGHLVGMLSSASTELEATAQSMTGTADQSNQQAAAVAAAAEEASTGMQTVASAAEELTASISEISRQVAQSSKITDKAVDDAKRTDAIVHALARVPRRSALSWA